MGAQTMKPLPQSVLAPTIAEYTEAVLAAKAALEIVVADAQASCEHRFVSEAPWKSSKYFAPMNAIRICNHCRKEEEGSHWSGGSVWSRHDFGSPELGNAEGRIILPVERDELYRMRVRS